MINYVIVGSDNGLTPNRRQAIIWTNASLLLTKPLGANPHFFTQLNIIACGCIGCPFASYNPFIDGMSDGLWKTFVEYLFAYL